jgi:hypothetical protein
MNLKCKAYKEILSTATKCARQFNPVVLLFSTAIGLTPGGSRAVLFYTQTVHTQNINNGTNIAIKKIAKCGPCPVFASYTLAFALQLKKSTEKLQLG